MIHVSMKYYKLINQYNVYISATSNDHAGIVGQGTERCLDIYFHLEASNDAHSL